MRGIGTTSSPKPGISPHKVKPDPKKDKEKQETPNIFRKLFGGWFRTSKRDAETIVPSTAGYGGESFGGAGGYRSGFPTEAEAGMIAGGGCIGNGGIPIPSGIMGQQQGLQPGMLPGDCTDPAGVYRFGSLPVDRITRYEIYNTMKLDPTIAVALRHHVTAALAPNTQTGKSISIESVNDDKESQKYVDDLIQTFERQMNEISFDLAFQSALYGISNVRIYGKAGVGVQKVRNDFYEQPRFITMYEHIGDPACFVSVFQDLLASGTGIKPMPPWCIGFFRIPMWDNDGLVEPIRTDLNPFDITREEWEEEGITESQNYGKSLLETAFDPWWDLQKAIIALNMSRQGAAILERLCGIDMGGLDPAKAANYINIISGQLDKTAMLNHKESVKRGYIPTIINRIFPIFSKTGSKGRVDIQETKSSPDIQGIEDVMFHLKRLCGTMGIDPSLVGFGDMLAGGLGEGGWYRLSIMAGLYANMIRKAISTGWERIFDIHLAWKYNKVFIGERPWRIKFNSVSSALENETGANQEQSINRATLLIQAMASLKEYGNPKFTNYVLTDIITGMEEEKVRDFLKTDPPPVPPGGEDGSGEAGSDGQSDADNTEEDTEEDATADNEDEKTDTESDEEGDDKITESASAMIPLISKKALKPVIYECLKEFYNN